MRDFCDWTGKDAGVYQRSRVQGSDPRKWPSKADGLGLEFPADSLPMPSPMMVHYHACDVEEQPLHFTECHFHRTFRAIAIPAYKGAGMGDPHQQIAGASCALIRFQSNMPESGLQKRQTAYWPMAYYAKCKPVSVSLR